MTLANKVDVVDAKFQEFAADCCVVVLSNASHPSLGPSYGVFMRLKQVKIFLLVVINFHIQSSDCVNLKIYF